MYVCKSWGEEAKPYDIHKGHMLIYILFILCHLYEAAVSQSTFTLKFDYLAFNETVRVELDWNATVYSIAKTVVNIEHNIILN
jgi:hypothetical protein